MAGVNLDADLGVKGFVKGTKDMEKALEDVSDELETVAKTGDDGLETLADKLKEAKRAADDARESGKDLGKGFKDGTDKAKEGVKDLNDNTKSNLKEVTASFDGSVSSIADGFQGLAAEAFEGFGPAGVLAGAALAAGIGLATAEMQKTEENAKKAKERVRELGTAFIESGADVAQIEAFQEALQGIVTNADDATVKIEDLRKFTKKYGDQVPSVAEFATAYAGNADAIEAVTEKLEESIQAEKDKNYDWDRSGREASKDKIQAWRDEADKLKAIQAETAAAAQIEKDYLATGGAEVRAKADAISQINAAYDEAVFSVDNFKNAETGIYDLDAYAASIEERGRLLEEYQNNLAESGLTTDQKAALNEMGVEQANAILNGLKDPNTSQKTKDTIKDGLKTASKEASAKIEAKADTTTAQADLDAIAKKRIAQIQVDFVNKYGKAYN
jgi:acylphosphatase